MKHCKVPFCADSHLNYDKDVCLFFASEVFLSLSELTLVFICMYGRFDGVIYCISSKVKWRVVANVCFYLDHFVMWNEYLLYLIKQFGVECFRAQFHTIPSPQLLCPPNNPHVPFSKL